VAQKKNYANVTFHHAIKMTSLRPNFTTFKYDKINVLIYGHVRCQLSVCYIGLKGEEAKLFLKIYGNASNSSCRKFIRLYNNNTVHPVKGRLHCDTSQLLVIIFVI